METRCLIGKDIAVGMSEVGMNQDCSSQPVFELMYV